MPGTFFNTEQNPARNQLKEARKGFFGFYSVCEMMKDAKEG